MIKLKNILFEEDSEKVFQKIVFGQKGSYNPSADKLVRFQGQLDNENDTSIEASIAKLLHQWSVTGFNPKTATALYKNLSILKDARKKYPKVFKPKTADSTLVYRGLSWLPSNLEKSLRTTSESDWKKQKIGKKTMMACSKPVNYVPENWIQSWTHDFNTALKFTKGGILTTKQDENFFFNQDFLKTMYGIDEKEIIHFGKKYTKPVMISIEEPLWQISVKPYFR